jgi:hypothetical protein
MPLVREEPGSIKRGDVGSNATSSHLHETKFPIITESVSDPRYSLIAFTFQFFRSISTSGADCRAYGGLRIGLAHCAKAS